MVFDTLTFKITVVVPTCAQSLDITKIMPPTLSGTSPGAFLYTIDISTA